MDTEFFELSDFGLNEPSLQGVVADSSSKQITVNLAKDAYIWITNSSNLFEIIKSHVGSELELSVEYKSSGDVNASAFISLRYASVWNDNDALPNHPVTLRVNYGLTGVKFGLRLKGSGTLGDLRVKLVFNKISSELSNQNQKASSAEEYYPGYARESRYGELNDRAFVRVTALNDAKEDGRHRRMAFWWAVVFVFFLSAALVFLKLSH